MPRKYSKNKKSRKGGKTRKQNLYVMKGCSKSRKNKSKKVFSSLGNSRCPMCGPKCLCGPNCNCPHKCPGNCYLNRPIKKNLKGGSGCGSCGCPIAPFSWKQMNMKQGGSRSVSQRGGKYHYPPNNVMKTGYVLPINKYPLGAGGQVGGNCGGTCGLQPPVQSGGAFYKPGAPIPGPFVGKPWEPSFSKWPGIDGIGGDRNYLKNYDSLNSNTVAKNPQTQQLPSDVDAGYRTWSSMIGGYKYSKDGSSPRTNSLSETKSKYKKGGGILPQDLVTLGSDLTYNLKSAYNTLNGYNSPVSPLPYQGQLTKSLDYNKLLL